MFAKLKITVTLHSSQFVEHTHYAEHTLHGARDLSSRVQRKYRVVRNKEKKKIEISEQLEIQSEVFR